MKIKKKYQNPKIEKRQKEEKKEVLNYNDIPCFTYSTACVTLDTSPNKFISYIIPDMIKVD